MYNPISSPGMHNSGIDVLSIVATSRKYKDDDDVVNIIIAIMRGHERGNSICELLTFTLPSQTVWS